MALECLASVAKTDPLRKSPDHFLSSPEDRKEEQNIPVRIAWYRRTPFDEENLDLFESWKIPHVVT